MRREIDPGLFLRQMVWCSVSPEGHLQSVSHLTKQQSENYNELELGIHDMESTKLLHWRQQAH